LAILSALASRHRLLFWKAQAEQLQQRLNDRILIERAKGILVQRLGISEEEAYKRLRVLSRRQRRQIRDIAQSLLDTQSLLLPGGNGLLDLPPHISGKEEPRSKMEPPAPS
jgi:response regulator NasT